MLNPHEPAILNPGIEEAHQALLDNLSVIMEELTHMFNLFIGTEDFDILTPIERSNLSFDFHNLIGFLQQLNCEKSISMLRREEAA